MLNEKLRAKRILNNMSIMDAANKLDMRASEYADIERGKLCTQDQVDKICALFSASAEDLALEVGASPSATTSSRFVEMLDENLCPTWGDAYTPSLACIGSRKDSAVEDLLCEAVTSVGMSNPGAMSVLCQLYEHDPQMFFDVTIALKKQSILGSDLWMLYKDYCEFDIEKMKEAVTEGAAVGMLESKLGSSFYVKKL